MISKYSAQLPLTDYRLPIYVLGRACSPSCDRISAEALRDSLANVLRANRISAEALRDSLANVLRANRISAEALRDSLANALRANRISAEALRDSHSGNSFH